MTAVVVVLVALLVIFLLTRLSWVVSHRERRSINDYGETLDVLAKLSSQSARTPSGRRPSPEEQVEPEGSEPRSLVGPMRLGNTRRQRPATWARRRPAGSEPEAPRAARRRGRPRMVFIDDSVAGLPGEAPVSPAAGLAEPPGEADPGAQRRRAVSGGTRPGEVVPGWAAAMSIDEAHASFDDTTAVPFDEAPGSVCEAPATSLDAAALDAAAEPEPATAAGALPERQPTGRAGEAPLVFIDDASPDAGAASRGRAGAPPWPEGGPASPGEGRRRAHRRRPRTGPRASLDGLGSRPDGGWAPAIGALAMGSLLGSRSRQVAASVAGVLVVAAVVAVVAVVALSGGGGPHPAGHHHALAHQAAAPTTTVAPVALVTSDATDATYRVDVQPYTLALTSNPGPCWVEIRTGGETGPLYWEGVIEAGQTKTVPASGPLWVRVGFEANISLSVNGTGLPATTKTPNPYNFSFVTG